MEPSNETVRVSNDMVALAKPNFIIEHDGRYYVAVAVLEYDPNAADMTDEQKRGVDQIKQMFEAAQGATPPPAPGGTADTMNAFAAEGPAPPRAAQIEPLMAMAGCMNTGPIIRR